MNYMISMFIDDEMDMAEKIEFIETVRKDKAFTDEALDLLSQEKIIRGDIVDRVPLVELKAPFSWKRFMRPFLQPMGLVAPALAAVIIVLVFFMPQPSPTPLTNRFVIYRPDVHQVEITGTFTDWKRVPLHNIGDSGYWEVSLDLAEGEHRFTYILEGRHAFADPTVPAREADDFGGQNSVLYVEQRI